MTASSERTEESSECDPVFTARYVRRVAAFGHEFDHPATVSRGSARLSRSSASSHVPDRSGSAVNCCVVGAVYPGMGNAERTDPDDAHPARVLVVGDEDATTTLLATALRCDGWEVERARTAAAAGATGTFAPDVLLLDHTDVGVLTDVRATQPGIPALWLTAPDTAPGRAAPVDGTDRITGPCALSTLYARLRRLLLGSREPDARAADLAVGDLVLHANGATAHHRDERIDLTPGEWLLLSGLMRAPGTTLTRSEITAGLWGHDFGGRDDIVDLYVACLRDKIDLPGAPRIVQVGTDGYALLPRAER